MATTAQSVSQRIDSKYLGVINIKAAVINMKVSSEKAVKALVDWNFSAGLDLHFFLYKYRNPIKKVVIFINYNCLCRT